MRELTFALVPPDEADPLARAEELITPYCLLDDWLGKPDLADEENPERPPWEEANPGWDPAGYLWLDRYGRPSPDHPVTGPEDEIRPAGEVNTCRIVAVAVITADGELHPTGKEVHSMGLSWAQQAAYEDLLRQYADHLTVPMTCYW